MVTGTKIVLCDDDTGIRSMLARHLEDEGYRVFEAIDGRMCLDMVANNNPEAILLDLKMPDMDGMQVIRQLKNLNSNIPILVVSGIVDLKGPIEDEELSVGTFIAKPFKLTEVSSLLRAALLESQSVD